MLKPLKKKAIQSLVPQTKKEDEKPSEIIVSIVNGQQVYSNADTGEIVSMNHISHTPAYEVFNGEKASIVISSLAQGRKLIDALEDGSISKSTFSSWMMRSDEFAQAVDKARSVRAQHAHEKFYANTIDEVTGELPDDKEDLKVHMSKLYAIERRQKILGTMKKEDNPHRFSDKDMSGSMAASVAISIDPEIITKMQTQFKTTLSSEGHLNLDASNAKLNEIINADYKEINDADTRTE